MGSMLKAMIEELGKAIESGNVTIREVRLLERLRDVNSAMRKLCDDLSFLDGAVTATACQVLSGKLNSHASNAAMQVDRVFSELRRVQDVLSVDRDSE
jgi:predicted AAA+ superfamily ATPase